MQIGNTLNTFSMKIIVCISKSVSCNIQCILIANLTKEIENSIDRKSLPKERPEERNEPKQKKDLKRNFFLFRSISDRALHFCRCVKHIDLFSKKTTTKYSTFFPIMPVHSTICCLGFQNLKFCCDIILILISNFDLENEVWYAKKKLERLRFSTSSLFFKI